jgi:hypothetical protein
VLEEFLRYSSLSTRKSKAKTPVRLAYGQSVTSITVCDITFEPARHEFQLNCRLTDTPCILSCLRTGHVFERSFGGDEGIDGFELVAGVGVGGGQLASGAWVRRSLTTDQSCGLESPLGARRETTQASGGS